MEKESDDLTAAVGDRVVPIERTEAEAEQMARSLAQACASDYPDKVGMLDYALSRIANDLGVNVGPVEVEALWMPAAVESLIRPNSPYNLDPGLPGDWWRGYVFVRKQHQLIIGLDITYGNDPIMYEIGRALQETVEEYFGRPRPACPLHNHALQPSLLLGVAIWACPTDDQLWWVRMGSYQEATGLRQRTRDRDR